MLFGRLAVENKNRKESRRAMQVLTRQSVPHRQRDRALPHTRSAEMPTVALAQRVVPQVVDDEPLVDPPFARQPSTQVRVAAPRCVDHHTTVGDERVVRQLVLVAVHAGS